jgi:5-methylcytosine-specific restriction endonuclease McrA
MLQDASRGLPQTLKKKKANRKKQRRIDEAKVCPYCLTAITLDNYSRDHLIPKARGGKFMSNNNIVCCKKCNFAKSILMPVEFLFGCAIDHHHDRTNNKNIYTILPFKHVAQRD